MDLRFEYVGPVTHVFNKETLVLLIFRARKDTYVFYRPTTWCLRWQAKAVITSTIEEYVTKLLREAD